MHVLYSMCIIMNSGEVEGLCVWEKDGVRRILGFGLACCCWWWCWWWWWWWSIHWNLAWCRFKVLVYLSPKKKNSIHFTCKNWAQFFIMLWPIHIEEEGCFPKKQGIEICCHSTWQLYSPAQEHNHRVSFGRNESQQEDIATGAVVALKNGFP